MCQFDAAALKGSGMEIADPWLTANFQAEALRHINPRQVTAETYHE
jgi:hypothetical protein